MKKVSWDINVIENEQKRPCECLGCSICRMNSKFCGIFGKYKCKLCKEWRCEKCIQLSICNHCNK